MILLSEQIEFIAKVTKMLNELGESPTGYYLRVLLTEEDSHETLGAWCDELGTDSWYFDTSIGK